MAQPLVDLDPGKPTAMTKRVRPVTTVKIVPPTTYWAVSTAFYGALHDGSFGVGEK